ncbi:hypothetical protein N7G274_000304 [Stereocaulon virgatum]|uniref:F-box domain-containing protein n=1 Tax=Stereocaulon virgatum TaxID=373712 RepID=A0ABR4ATD6_9LECA
MVAFTKLPPELILEIAKNVEPPHLASFYGVNQNVYLQTKQHRERYQYLKRRFAQPLSTSHPGSTAELLKSIILEPETALYVQEWRLDNYRFDWGPRAPHEPVHVEYSEADMIIFESAIRELHDDDNDRIVQAVRDGDEEPLIYITLTKLPNLTSVILQNLNGEERLPSNDLLYFSINKIVSSSLSSGGVPQNQSATSLMPNLNQVWVEPGFNPDNWTAFIDAGAIEAFAALPSVREINGHRIGGYRNDIMVAYPVETSYATVLKLSMCDISAERMFLFLEGFKHLQEFTYWPAARTESLQPYEPLFIVRALMFAAKDTLRRLTLRSASTRTSYMGSLRRFNALEYLETDLTSLIADFTRDITLELALPPTLQQIKLFDRDNNRPTVDYFLTEVADKEALLPHLDQLTFVLQVEAMADTEMEEWKKEYQMAGISLEFEDYDQIPLPLFAKSHAFFPYYMEECS